MRQILFVQGGGEDVHDRWDNHLVDSLQGELGPAHGYDVWRAATISSTIGSRRSRPTSGSSSSSGRRMRHANPRIRERLDTAPAARADER